MVEAARLGQLSTVRMLLDGGTATVEDQDEVSVCVCTYLSYYATSKQQYMALIVRHVLIIHHTLLVCVHVVCMLVLVLAYCCKVGFHSHAYMSVYLQYIYVAMTTVGSEWHA